MICRVKPLRDDDDSEPFAYSFECPGCGQVHEVTVTKVNSRGEHWFFNGSKQFPTFNPLIRNVVAGDRAQICAVGITDGKAKFYPESTHALAGHTVDLKEFEL